MKTNDEHPQGPLRSGTLARLASLSADTLRFYERRGLLQRPPRDANGYRRYPPGALQRVLVIQQALAAGFSVDELSRILRRRDSGGAPCREVYRIARERMDQLEERILSLTELRDQLRVVIAGWEQRLTETAPGERAGLLDQLALKKLPARARPRTVG